MDKDEVITLLVDVLEIKAMRHFITEEEIDKIFLTIGPALERTLASTKVQPEGVDSND